MKRVVFEWSPWAVCVGWVLSLAIGLRADPGPVSRPIPQTQAKSTLDGQIRSYVRASGCDPKRVGVAVVDSKGKLRVLHEADTPLRPASNMKILTTAAGLSLLGETHEYVPRLETQAPIQAGVVAGSVFVLGTGDPNISGRFHDKNPTALFETWAKQLRAAGVLAIAGDLVADDSFFDQVRFPDGWNKANAGRWYSAEISPLALNDNCVDIRIHPTRIGAKARVEVVPSSPFIKVTGAPTTIGGRDGKSVRIHRAPDSNEIRISGKIGSKVENWYDHVAVVDPSLFFVHTLESVLKKHGVAVRGRVRRATAAEIAARTRARRQAKGGVPVGWSSLIEHRSKLLLDIPVINKRSQNLHAEILLKAIGQKFAQRGSIDSGGRGISAFLGKLSVPSEGLLVTDGSGLSYDNRITARQLAKTLHSVRSLESFRSFRESLPISGTDGTLEKRFRRHPKLVGKVFAKTGYIKSVSALSGYVERDGLVWSFAIICNSFPRSGVGGARALQERIVARLFDVMKGS